MCLQVPIRLNENERERLKRECVHVCVCVCVCMGGSATQNKQEGARVNGCCGLLADFFKLIHGVVQLSLTLKQLEL